MPLPRAGLTLLGGVAYWALAVMFLSGAAANNLTFRQDRSSVGTKVLALLIVAVTWGVALGSALTRSMTSAQAPATFALTSCVFIGTWSLFWIAADRHVPPRHEAWLAKHGPRARQWYYFVSDGAAPTAAYLAAILALVAAGVLALRAVSPRTSIAAFSTVRAVDALTLRCIPLTLTYVLYSSTLAGCVTLLLSPRQRTPRSRRVLLVVLLLVNVMPVALWPLLAGWRQRPEPGYALAFLPVAYVIVLVSDKVATPLTAVLGHLSLPLGIGVMYHVVQGYRDAARARPAQAAAEKT